MLDLVVALSLSMVTSYHIGNSLMNDGLGNYANGTVQTGTYGLEAVGRQYGYDYTLAMHIDASMSMQSIWENPDGVGSQGVDTQRNAFGPWDEALANFHWDHVLFEPYAGQSSTLGLDKVMIDNFIDYTRQNPANQDTIFYVYQVWPQKPWTASEGGFPEYWQGMPEVSDSTFTRPRRANYDYLMDWAQDTYAPQGILVRTVPVGEVWNRVILAIESGEIIGITEADLYRDDLHASGLVGRYLAAVTNFAVLFQRDVNGLVPPSAQFPTDENASINPPYSQALYDQLNKIIWEVVSSDPYTGIADFNDDGFVSQADMTLWRNSYGASAAADADGDGDSDGRDFMIWQRAFQAASMLAAATVPEPATAILISCGMILFCGRRIRR